MEPGLEISIPQNDAHHHLHPVAQTPSSWLLAPVVDDRLFDDFVRLTLWRRPAVVVLLVPLEAGALAVG